MTDKPNNPQADVADILDRAADLIEPEGAWTQGAFVRDAFGSDVYEAFREEAADAACFCLYGAIGSVIGRDPEGYRDADPLLEAVLGVSSPYEVAKWNDAPERTQAEVVAKLREAALLARQKAPHHDG